MALFLLVLLLVIRSVSAGQLFTQGLAVINAPSAGSPAHAGGNLPISVEVSGNGKLPSDSVSASSTLPTHFQSLEIFLVSSQTNLNLTVSVGPAFLSLQGGTVRQMSWPVPTCIPPGQYNLTFYEKSQFEGQSIFTITSIPIPVENTRPSGQCAEGVNNIQPQPQESSPLARSPFEQNSVSLTSGMKTSLTPTATLLTITLPTGVFDLPTVTETATVVILSKETLTMTVSGSLSTTTRSVTLTTQLVDDSTFFPVNASVFRPAPTIRLVSVLVVVFTVLEGLVVVCPF